MSARYRAEQIGSLLRPTELLAARDRFAAGAATRDELTAAEDRAIEQALEMQRQVGLDVFVDGEYRRRSYMMGLYDAVEGFEVPPAASEGSSIWRGKPLDGYPRVNYPVAAGKLKARGRLAAREASFLKEHSPGPWKVTLPGAQMIGSTAFRAGLTEPFYATRGELMAELAGLLRQEVQALVADGVPYVQIDAPAYTQFADPLWRQRLERGGTNLEAAISEAIAADNAIVDGLAGKVTLGFHLCRGNSGGQWLSEGGYDPIAEQLFSELRYDTFLLEYDTDRAGDFAPLRFMPSDRVVVLGLITTKSPDMESPDELLRRIEAAARYIPMENLALSPQCGFASSIPGNPLSWDEQRRKLELVVQTAAKAWG
ncbi:MAG TPA: cobalamin-independent methionine synthase II family protein [Chloroflexota bacterium]|nr:cobalamin-independent methionine synthase II family protein [Chloroflexota bacterium]